MPRTITPEPLTAPAFAPYGDILAVGGDFRLINDGFCRRHNDRARLDFAPDGRAGISIFQARPRALPYDFDLIERHPLGSQAFIPMSWHPFLVIVADTPNSRPRAFISSAGQAINFHRGTWHGVLTPLHEPGIFAVIDYIGPSDNLHEHRLTQAWRVLPPAA